MLITGNKGIEHTIHFALENQFYYADYSNFDSKTTINLQFAGNRRNPSSYLATFSTIEWGYKNLKEGQRNGATYR